MLHHHFLDHINLVIDPELNALCCNICLVALAPSQVKSHLHLKHHGTKLNKPSFDQLVDFLNLPECLPLPSINRDGITPFRGLKILDGFACHNCPCVLGTKKNLRAHHHEAHSDIPIPDVWPSCKMQQYNRGGSARMLWRVLDHPVAITTSTSLSQVSSAELVINNLRKQISSIVSPPSVPQDERVISPWLRFTKWHEHVNDYDVNLLLQLVQVPDTADMDPAAPGIRSAVETYYNEAIELLKVTDDLILQKLNSPDPKKE